MAHVDGIVLGLPEWGYHLGAGGCSRLFHRATGQRIYLDPRCSPEVMTRQDFCDYFRHDNEPEPVERRLNELLPRCAGLPIALDALEDGGLICRSVADVPVRLKLRRRLCLYAGPAREFLTRWADPEERVWLAALIGDWPAAHEAAQSRGDAELAAVTGLRAEECWRRWLSRVRRWVKRTILDAGGLRALAHAGADDLPKFLKRALADPYMADVVMEMIEDDPSWCPRVFRLLTRGPHDAGDHNWLFLGRACVSYLARHRYRIDDVFDCLLPQQEVPLDALIPVALGHRRDVLLHLLRRGLRSDYESRLVATAVLALFDTVWSRRELTTCLAESDDWEATMACRRALRESRDPEAERAAERWEAEHPEGGPDRLEDRCCDWSFEDQFRAVATGLFDLVLCNRDYSPGVEAVG